MNGSAAERVFAWFRGYAKLLNSKQPRTHHFHVLLFSKKHNALMARNEKGHLPTPKPDFVKKSKSYHCSKARMVMKSIMKSHKK